MDTRIPPAVASSRMPFAYFTRLTRRQQAIYLESDGITAMPLPQAPRLQPLVTALARALESGDRVHTEATAQRLVLGLSRALGAPPARVKVLAAAMVGPIASPSRPSVMFTALEVPTMTTQANTT